MGMADCEVLPVKRSKPPCHCCSRRHAAECNCAGLMSAQACLVCDRCQRHCTCPDGWLDPTGCNWEEMERRKLLYV